MREMRRLRLVAIAAAVVITVIFAALVLLVTRAALFLLPLILGGWYIWYMPWWRRKVRQRARRLHPWELRPE